MSSRSIQSSDNNHMEKHRRQSKSPLTMIRHIEEGDQDSNKYQMEKFTFQNKKKKNFFSYKYNPNENTVFLNFDVKEFDNQNLVNAQNMLTYGVQCYKCSSYRKEPQQVLIIQNTENPLQIDVIYTVGQINWIESFQYNEISELQEGSTFKLPRKESISHATYQNTLCLQIDSQNMAVTLIFQSQEQRDSIWQGFQNIVIEYLCNQTVEQEPNKLMDFQDIQDFLRQIKIQSSKNQLMRYFYQKDKDRDKNKKIDLGQVEKIIKVLVDKSEVREIFKYYTAKEFLNCDERLPCMTLNDFQRFLFNIQKQDKDSTEIQEIFHKLHKDKKNQISINQPSHLISFQQFCKFIFSKKNTIFNPDKLDHHMEMDRPITDYYINCCRHFYSAKIDIESILMIQKEKEGADFETKFLPIHFILRKGVRCASIDVWDGDEFEPVILYGYTMSSKVKLSEMLKVFVKYVFKGNTNPFFLELDLHCQPKVLENAKRHIEEILLPYLYRIPDNYEEIKKYPSLYELQYKIILMGKLPFKIRNEVNADYKKQLALIEAKMPDSIDDEIRFLDEQEVKDQQSKNENLQKYSSKQADEVQDKKPADNNPKLKDHLDKKYDQKQQHSFGNFKNPDSNPQLGSNPDLNQDTLSYQAIEQEKQKQLQQASTPQLNVKNLKKIKENPESVVEKYFSLYLDRFVKSQSSLFDVFELTKSEYETITTSNLSQLNFNNNNNIANNNFLNYSNANISRNMNRDSSFKGEELLKGLNQTGLKQELNVSQSFISPSPPPKSNNLSQMYINHSNIQQQQQQQPPLQLLQQINLTNTAAQGYSDLRSFTQQHLMKLNPSGKKADATNFDPCLPIWQGVQFLMLSHHQFDIHSLIYSSFFMQNGGKKGGYILKPQELLQEYVSESIKSISDIKRMVYYIKIISGSQLRSLRGEQVDPQVNVILRQPTTPIAPEPSLNLLKNSMWAIQDTHKPYQHTQMFSSSIVSNNNSNPIFEYEFKFTVSDPQVSFLIFNVVNTRYDNMIGWYALPVNCIRQGYRIVPLQDENMNSINNSCLLCYIKFTQDI